MPKYLVGRKKLSLPASTNCWINALGGRSLLCLNKALDPTQTQALEEDILTAPETLGVLGPCPEPHRPGRGRECDRRPPEELNLTRTVFPGTRLLVVNELPANGTAADRIRDESRSNPQTIKWAGQAVSVLTAGRQNPGIGRQTEGSHA